MYDGYDKSTDKECMTDMIRVQTMDDGDDKSTDRECMTDMTRVKIVSI